jgi:hypothetical protein
LKRVCDFLLQTLFESGFVTKDEKEKGVKLHATLLNTKYRKQDKKEEDEEKERLPIDASAILKGSLAEFQFGEIKLSDIQLSDRAQLNNNGYWKSECAISLP